MTQPKFKFGDQVREIFSGFTGRISAITLDSNRNWMMGVQPMAQPESTVLPDCINIDEDSLKLVDPSILDSFKKMQSIEDLGYDIGDVVRCRVTGIEGVVIGFAWYVNGCCYARIMLKTVKEGQTPETYSTPAHFLEYQRRSALSKDPGKPAEPRGGPNKKVERPWLPSAR